MIVRIKMNAQWSQWQWHVLVIRHWARTKKNHSHVSQVSNRKNELAKYQSVRKFEWRWAGLEWDESRFSIFIYSFIIGISCRRQTIKKQRGKSAPLSVSHPYTIHIRQLTITKKPKSIFFQAIQFNISVFYLWLPIALNTDRHIGLCIFIDSQRRSKKNKSTKNRFYACEWLTLRIFLFWSSFNRCHVA